MPAVQYEVVPVDPKRPHKDPPETWEQKGDTTPGSDPPIGVQSSPDVIPSLQQPNFVPCDPLPLMQHAPEPMVLQAEPTSTVPLAPASTKK
jgi:hypothetical protein